MSSTGKLDSVDASVKSLHFRRSILIKDTQSQKIWLLHGKSVAAKTKKAAEKAAKSLNAELGFQFKLNTAKVNENQNIVEKLLEAPKPTNETKKQKTVKQRNERDVSKGIRRIATKASVPSVPIASLKKEEGHRPRGDLDVGEGPEISEFGIAYYGDQETGEGDIFEATVNLLRKILEIKQQQPDKKKAKEFMSSAINEIIDQLY